MVVATCSPVLAHALPPKWLDRAWGILGAGWGIGEVVALLVMPSIQNAGGYRAVFLTTAGLGLRGGARGPLAESGPGAALSSRGGDHGPWPGHRAGSVITNRKVLLLSLINAAALAIGVGILVWTPQFLQDIHGSTENISLYLLAGLGVAQLVGNPLGAIASGRWGKYGVIIWSMIPMVVVTALWASCRACRSSSSWCCWPGSSA